MPPLLLETLARELERPREITAQVVSHITGTYGVDRDAVGTFLTEELPKLEDYEHDLVLSPLFTPKLADQAIFAELLGRESIPQEQWPSLIQELAARPTLAQLVTSNGRSHPVMLREVAVERYVRRLRLDATVPEALFAMLHQAPAADHPMLKAVARRAVWEDDARRHILERYLLTAGAGVAGVAGVYRLADTVELLSLMESYRPIDAADLLARIPRWQRVLQEEINTGPGSKPFFSANIQHSHGFERDQRHQDNIRMAAKKEELAFLDRLLQLLETVGQS